MRLLKIIPEIEKCLPPLDEDTYNKLKENIKLKGYDPACPIVLWKGYNTIVDGHHRYKICQELRKEPSLVERYFKSTDEAILYALEHQENRRNLEPAQIALIGTKRLLLKEEAEAQKRERAGTPAPVGVGVGGTSKAIAREIGVAARTVDRVKTVLKANEPRLEAMLTKGEIEARPAEDFIKLEPSKPKRLPILLKGSEAVKERVSELRQKNNEEKQFGKFLEVEKEIDKGYTKNVEQLEKICSGAETLCLPGNLFEAWCQVCGWGFDVFKPYPTRTKNLICPYCGDGQIDKREALWHPRLK